MNPVRIQQTLLLGLVFLLIFEGIFRKLAPGPISTLLLFAKDGICIVLVLTLATSPPRGQGRKLFGYWFAFMAVFSIPFMKTLFISPPLAIFGAKQYILFPVVAIAMTAAFPPSQIEALKRHFAWFAYSVIITFAVSMLQLALPDSHWLNRGIGGMDLRAFAAGGVLRVSSTFPFVAQYSMYLNALIFGIGLMLAIGLPKRFPKLLKKIPIWAVLLCYGISLFATGSRQSVIGTAIMFSISLFVLLLGNRTKVFTLAIRLLVVMAVVIGAAQFILPKAFVVYELRSEYSDNQSELASRLSYSLFGWVDGLPGAPPNFLGYGIGVMSNGSEKISGYAAEWRDRIWGETESSNVMFEGGWWLMATFFGFRLAVTIWVVSLALKIRSSPYFLGAASITGFVIFVALFGQLSIQPPLSCWFWMAVGTAAVLANLHRADLIAANVEKDTESPSKRSRRRRGRPINQPEQST
ncbi:MAG: hypothetical protein AAFX93_12110 [Verrucomicrobiota bacterium]